MEMKTDIADRLKRERVLRIMSDLEAAEKQASELKSVLDANPMLYEDSIVKVERHVQRSWVCCICTLTLPDKIIVTNQVARSRIFEDYTRYQILISDLHTKLHEVGRQIEAAVNRSHSNQWNQDPQITRFSEEYSLREDAFYS